jgi:hypothetical protein
MHPIHGAYSYGSVTLHGLMRSLAAARDRLANHGNGTFGKWCNERCGITHQHANRAIAAHQQFGSSEHRVQNFDATSLYLLSADSCPDEAYEEALERAEHGEGHSAKAVITVLRARHFSQYRDFPRKNEYP